ncbi:MAG: hypothetical protein ACTSY1_02800, partial [Alphaproteobacteria bacterium]
AVLALSAPCGLVQAQEGGALPAVSAPNYKFDFRFGSFDGTANSNTTFETRGSYSAPLSFDTGLQIDGAIASVEGGKSAWGSLGGHYFWRDPAVGLAGAYADVNWYDNISYATLAFEGEYYHDRFTFSTATGVQFGDVDTSFFTDSYVYYYPTDDLKFGGGYRHDAAGGYGLVRAEYQIMPDAYGMSLFADGKWNENGFDTVMGGIRFYFGAPKSLIRRHREDDPESHADKVAPTTTTTTTTSAPAPMDTGPG